jgi:hypothetical protein
MSLNVVLDIDETLIHHLTTEKWATVPPTEKAKYEAVIDGKDVFVLRPEVRKFLKLIFARYRVSLWTWSDADYAKVVANLLTDGRPERFAHIWSSEHAAESEVIHGNSKDLNYLWYVLGVPGFLPCNTILVDDLPANVNNSSNLYSSIQVAPFVLFGDKARNKPYSPMDNDTTLRSVYKIIRGVAESTDFCVDGDLPFPFPDRKDVPLVKSQSGGARKRRNSTTCRKVWVP